MSDREASLYHDGVLVLALILGMAVLLVTKPALAHPGHGALIKSLAAQELSPELSLAGAGIAFLAGASHALSPGHGKTMVAAYLVGSQGTPQHAILLGVVTTITHTVGVFALGVFTLFASQYILPEQLYPVLSAVSGMIVCGVGFWLLDTRLHSTDSHTHDHEHHHNHHHHSTTLRSLMTLGIAGGMVPCPSALVLLLSAIALHQAVYGMVLVSLFSAGLATVLIAIGLAVVYAYQWFDTKQLINTLPITKTVRQYLPIGSSVFIITIGIVLTACSVI